MARAQSRLARRAHGRDVNRCAETRRRFAITIRVTFVGAYLLVFALPLPHWRQVDACRMSRHACRCMPSDGWQEGMSRRILHDSAPLRRQIPMESTSHDVR